MGSPAPSFSATELSLALAELGWGLQSWELLPAPPGSSTVAHAKLDLLEQGQSVHVEICSERGWRVLPVVGVMRSFETLDALLVSVSPMFEARRIKLLHDTLSNISARRSWDEGEEYEG